MIRFICLVLVLMASCHIQTREEQREAYIKEIYQGIQYLRDPKTCLCFAYYWGGAANGGPALAAVPCDQVARYLLNPGAEQPCKTTP